MALSKSYIPIARSDGMKRIELKAKEADDILYRNAKGIFLLLEEPKNIGDIVRYLAGEDTKSKRGQVNDQKRRLFGLKLNGKDAITDSYGLTLLASAKKGREVIVKGDRSYVHDKRSILKGLVPEVYGLISSRLGDSVKESNRSEFLWEMAHSKELSDIRKELDALLGKDYFRKLVFGTGFWTKAFSENEVNDKVFFPFRSVMGFVNFALLTFLCRYHIHESGNNHKINYTFLLNTLIRIVSKNTRQLYSDNVGNSTEKDIQKFESYFRTGKDKKEIGSILRHSKKAINLQTLERNIKKQMGKRISGKVKEEYVRTLERYFSLYFGYPFRELIEEGLDMKKAVSFLVNNKIPVNRLLQLDLRARLERLVSE